MSGTLAGGKKAAEKNKRFYGKDFYKRIGALGGMNGYGKGYKGGFASDAVGEDGMTGRERAKVAGALGGRKSSRRGVRNGEGRRALADIARAERILEKEDDDGGDF